MERLQLLDEARARDIYGLPADAERTTREEAIRSLVQRGWSRGDAERHVRFAIAAGCYAVVEDESATPVAEAKEA